VTPRPIARLVQRVSGLLDPYGRFSYGQEGEDIILLRIFEEEPPGFYVDVGAHHPVRFSNTWALYQRGWRGINIDPNPAAIRLFERLRPRDINLTLGIAEEAKSLHYFQFNDSALNTYDAELAAQRQARDGYRLLKTTMEKVARLDCVLAEHLPAGQSIDVLSVDVEGLDLKVIRSNDWTRFRPSCLLMEALHTTLSSLTEHEAHRYVTALGYDLFAKTVNTLIYLDRDSPRRLC